MAEEPSGITCTSDRRRGIGAEPTEAVASRFDRAPAREPEQVSPARRAVRRSPMGCRASRTGAPSGGQLDRRP